MLDDAREETEVSKDLSADERYLCLRINQAKRIIGEKDDIIQSIKSEFEQHKKEHQQLKDQLINLIEEKKQLQHEIFKPNNVDRQPEQMHSDQRQDALVESLKTKLKILNHEKENIVELWNSSQKTVAALETEVAHYRRQLRQPDSVQSIRNEYLRRLKEMDGNVKELRNKLENETLLSNSLKKEKAEAEVKANDLESRFKEILSQKKQIVERCMKAEAALINAKSQITILSKEKSKLEIALEKSKRTVEEHISKETEAISKVQEALNLAESALLERDASLSREKESREECDYLARTIGQVMEEAAKKVDDDIESMRKDHQKQIERLADSLQKNKSVLEAQHKRTKAAESKCKHLEEQVKNLSRSNMLLDSDLHKASQTIIDLELKIDTLDKGIKREQEHSKMCEEKIRHLQDLIENSRKTKTQWKQVTLDITSKLQSKVNELQAYNRKLEDQNCKLQRQLLNTRQKQKNPENTSSECNGYEDDDQSSSKS